MGSLALAGEGEGKGVIPWDVWWGVQGRQSEQRDQDSLHGLELSSPSLRPHCVPIC